MKRFLLFLLLAVGPALTAKLPVIPGVEEGRDRFAQSTDFLDTYLPPTVPRVVCDDTTVYSTQIVTSTSTTTLTRPGVGDRTVVTTRTQLIPTTIIVPTGSEVIQTTTIFSTYYTTVLSTRIITSTYREGAATQIVTRTVTRTTPVVDYVTRTTTQFSTLSEVVTRTQLSTQLVQTTYTTTVERVSTQIVTQTIPGSTIYITQTSTIRDIVTRTSPPQTITKSTTVIRTDYQTQTERIPGPAQTVFVTIGTTLTSTVLSTFNVRQTQYVTDTAYETRLSTTTAFITQTSTNAVTRTEVVTSTIRSTVVSTQNIPTTVTEGRVSTTVIRIPAETIVNRETVTRTTTVGGRDRASTTDIIRYETSTNIVTRTVPGGQGRVTITATKTEPCERATYNYNEPANKLVIG